MPENCQLVLAGRKLRKLERICVTGVAHDPPRKHTGLPWNSYYILLPLPSRRATLVHLGWGWVWLPAELPPDVPPELPPAAAPELLPDEPGLVEVEPDEPPDPCP